ncbi:hypothetical protein SSX86_008222 [Deinandra increscens subsp. villosa]|uniref:Bifunctional inhibitor/plant lipid transfer protein/seed storage helical domain-containing protein n=1 Tax=Deinandra increscens subsp. villosa TaxID=3103831 RepID=A0AAP0DF24_9ASTR
MKNVSLLIGALLFLVSMVHADDCDPNIEIPECLDPLKKQANPGDVCCNQLREHTHCLCGYIDINNSNHPQNYQFLPELVAKCPPPGIPFPRCPIEKPDSQLDVLFLDIDVDVHLVEVISLHDEVVDDEVVAFDDEGEDDEAVDDVVGVYDKCEDDEGLSNNVHVVDANVADEVNDDEGIDDDANVADEVDTYRMLKFAPTRFEFFKVVKMELRVERSDGYIRAVMERGLSEFMEEDMVERKSKGRRQKEEKGKRKERN